MKQPKAFQLYSKYYDLLYQDKDYANEANFVLKKLRKYQPKLSSILELGSGTGNHAHFLARDLNKMVGIEQSKEMLEMSAQKQIPNFIALNSSISNFSYPDRFDSAIALFHVISYLTDLKELISCFNCVNQHLNNDGLFLFDVWYTPCVLTEKPAVRVKRWENEEIKITRIAEPKSDWNESIVKVNFEVHVQDKKNDKSFILNEMHPMRHFTLTEIKLLSQLTGFEVMEYAEFLTDKPLNQDTWGAYFILRKVNT